MSASFLAKIQTYMEESQVGLEKWICSRLLESTQDLVVYLTEIISSGGKTGGIGELLYYKDIYPFFDTYYDEIQYAITIFQKNGGVLEIQEDMKSECTWLAVQLVTSNIATALGLQI